MRRRLVTLALASTSLVAIAFLVPLALLVSQLATDRAVRPAELAARSLAPTAALVDDDVVLQDVLTATAADLGGTASLVRPDGTVLGDPVVPDPVLERVREQQRSERVVDGEVQRVLVPVLTEAGVAVVDVRVPVDRTGVVVAWTALGVLAVVLVGGGTLLVDRLARDTVRAAQALEATASRLSGGDLDATADVTSPPDLARVSAALDQLAGRIEELLSEAREDAADVSHRLRTPLTALRLDVEALPAGAARDDLVADLAALDAAVSSVIDEARAPVRAGAGEGADLVAAVAERVAFWSGLAEDEQRPLDADLPPGPLRTRLPVADVHALVDVLLDNVFRHTPAGTGLRVAVRPDAAGVVLEVADDGPGFPPGARVLERGHSGGGGSGLGLDIVRRSVERAGGVVEVAATDAASGAGATVRCHLPTA